MLARRPSPAMVVALLALFVALGGSSYAAVKIKGKNIQKGAVTSRAVKNGSLTGRDVKTNSMRGKQIKESSLGTVPKAAGAENAAKLGGTAAGLFARKSELAAAGPTNLALASGWANINPGSGPGPARAYTDPSGAVHLAGLIGSAGGPALALTLPASLRPKYQLEFSVPCDDQGDQFNPLPGVIFIDTNGQVRAINDGVSPGEPDCLERISLDGITYRRDG